MSVSLLTYSTDLWKIELSFVSSLLLYKLESDTFKKRYHVACLIVYINPQLIKQAYTNLEHFNLTNMTTLNLKGNIYFNDTALKAVDTNGNYYK